MKTYPTREEAMKVAVEKYGPLAIETGTVNIIKVGPMIAKHMGCDVGFAIQAIEEE